MDAKTLTMLAVAALLAAASPAHAQTNDQTGATHGQDAEFGSIRTPYSADMNGQRVPVEARIALHHDYQEKDSRFFMFAWSVQGTPLDVTFDSLVRTDTGKEMPCYQRQGTQNDQIKC